MYRFLAHFFYLVIYFLGVLFFGFYVGSRHGSSVKCVMGKNVPLLRVSSSCNLSFLCCRDAFKFHVISFLIWGVIFYAIILIHSSFMPRQCLSCMGRLFTVVFQLFLS